MADPLVAPFDTGAGDWTAPGIFEVGHGIYRIPLPMPDDALRAVNVYAIIQPGGIVLIDSGWGISAAKDALIAALRRIGAGLPEITRFLMTHAHRDHYTLAVLVRRELGTQVAVGAGERSSLEMMAAAGPRFLKQITLLRRAGADELADGIATGNRRVDPLPDGWELPDVWLDASTLPLADRTLQIIPTPGHTKGHLVFHDPTAGVLFAGDHVLPHITPSIGFEPAPSESPLRDYLGSLRIVRRLPESRLLPAHGPIQPQFHDRVDALLDHHDQRLTQMAAAVTRLGGATAAQVAAEVTWTRHLRPFSTLDPFNQMLAVTETLAHLDLLAERGRIGRTPGEPATYRPIATLLQHSC